MPTPPEDLAELIRTNQPCVVLTGAGVSTESGIPDFRSPTGIWADFDPRDLATLGAFRRDPEKVWRFYAPRFSILASAEPNRAHRALVDLEELGLLRAVITQNIDLLHGRAGSREVVEVHGSIRTSSCPGCASAYPLAEVVALIETGRGAPRCPDCGSVLKPDVVFFDELLSANAIDQAFAFAREARLLLVVGSSLEVHPVAELPEETLDAGGRVAVVNEGPTRVDGRATLRIEGRAGPVLAEAVAQLTPARLVDYDPGWPAAFESERAHVAEALGDLALEIQHMGSTAVPGLAAKPVLDLLAGLRTLGLPPERIAAVERLGYEYKGEYGLPGRLFFRKGGGRRTHHLHAVKHGSELWRRHLAFRDYLRAHPDEAERYAAEKRRAAARDLTAPEYWEVKKPHVDALLHRAWAWYGTRERPPGI